MSPQSPAFVAHMTVAKVQILPLRRARPPGKAKSCKDRSPSNSGNDSSNSSDAHVVTTKRARASKPKVRSGCSTCKIRRVKCDETKPACVKCTSTGRTCDGYPSPPPRKNRALACMDQWPEPARGLAMFPVTATPSELRALEYFCLKTAPNLGMHFDADFWNRVVIPASVAEPALRHAMVAVGIFAEQRELIDIQNLALTHPDAVVEKHAPAPSFPLERTHDRSDLLALSNYNKSIGLLTKLVSSSAKTADLVLLACILFVCVELLRGDEIAAIRHFTGGMTILMDNLSTTQRSPGSKMMMNRVKDSIMPAFNRLEMLYALLGNSATWQYSVSLSASVPDSFSSVSQARDSMVHLMNLSLRFIQSIQFLEYEPFAIPASAWDAQAALLNHLQLWQARFTAYKSSCATKMVSDDAYAANVLEIQRIVACTWLSTSTTPFQCAHDVHIPAYTTAVILAEQLSKIASMRTKSVGKAITFLLDVEIVGPLYYVCVKCREPAVRRRAISVMRDLSRREGIWDSRILAAIAERVVAVEEVDMLDGGLPSETARIHNLPFASETDLRLEGYLTGWYKKPFGVYGDWLRWEEHVKLDARPAIPRTAGWSA